MALSGSFGNTFRTGYRIQVDWSATQDIANNASTITANFYLVSLGSSYTISSSATKSGYTDIGGQVDSFSGAGLAGLTGNQKKLLRTTTFTVNHNADGSLTTGILSSFDLNLTLSGVYWGTVQTSSDITLDTIPRASTIATFNNFTINGSAIPLTLAIASTAFNHEVVLKIGSTIVKTQTFAAGVVPTGITLSAAEQNILYNAMPSSTSGTVTLNVTTKNGTTQIGDIQTKNITATIDTATQKPSSLSITIAETATLTGYGSTVIGVYAQLLSRVKATLNATASTGATIASKTIKFKSGATVLFSGNSPLTSGAFNVSGTITVEGVATDSRGVSVATTTTFTLVAYSVPTIDTAMSTVFRCNSAGTADPNGTYVKARIVGSVSTIPNSTQRNQLFYTLRQRVKGTTTWSTTNAVATVAHTYGTLTVDFTSGALGGENYATANGYEFQIEVKDFFSVSLYEVTIVGNTVMSWSKTGVGIGKVWTQGALDVEGNSFFNGSHVTKLLNDTVRINNNLLSYVGGSTVTGAIKITLPKSWSNTMLDIIIRGYDYSASGTWSVRVGGYISSSSVAWNNPSVVIEGCPPIGDVRLGHDGTKCCIVLGDIASSWKYPKVVIDRVMSSYSGVADWETGWDISAITDETGITFSASQPSIMHGSVYTGSIFQVGFTTAPKGWLLCDGSAVSRTTYGGLFKAIGTTFGTGDGSTTFNLPDLRGRFPVGKAASGTFATLNNKGGAETHTLTIDEMPSHKHRPKNADSSWKFVNNGSIVAVSAGSSSYHASNSAYWQLETDSTGGGSAHNNLPPYITLNYIIKY